MSQEAVEQFTIKVHSSNGDDWKWLRKNGDKVVLTSRKSLRNFIRNNLAFTECRLYLNGHPFSFGDASTAPSTVAHQCAVASSCQ